jgi:arylsulfatase A-like enzyme
LGCRSSTTLGLVLLLVGLASACGPSRAIPSLDADVAETAADVVGPGTGAPPGRKHVVILSLDGCRPDALAAAPAPNLVRFGDEGVRAAQAFTIPLSLTLPSHSSMLSGYDLEHHGVSWNGAAPEQGYIKVPTIFAVAHSAGLRTVMIVGKPKFVTLQVPGTLDELSDVTNDEDGIVDTAIWLLGRGDFDLMFIHLPNPDLTGHAQGWMSPPYLAKVAHVDELFGRLLRALPADGSIIVTADHGGHDFTHGQDTDIDRHIPWMIAGPNIRKHAVVERRIATMDTAATALRLLGLELGADAQGAPVVEAFAN